VADALAVQEAGAFAVVLELVPDQLSRALTERLHIPTIGIGAGPGCSAEVQVLTDLLGMSDWHPKHAKPFADLRGTVLDAVGRFKAEVEAGSFPGPEQTVAMDDTTLDEVLGRGRLDRAAAIDALIPLDRDL
jgi:3-methyl-2-oxobutanoate hydroxymethyltransferase